MWLLGNGALTLLCAAAVAATAMADGDYYFWNYMQHPYQTYYLEDFCGPVNGGDCASAKHSITLDPTGSGSALIIRGFRDEKPRLTESVKCCITVKTRNSTRFNVQLDEIFMRTKNKIEAKIDRKMDEIDAKMDLLGNMCENFVRFHGLEEELGFICGEIERHSFKTPSNEMEIEYVLNKDNAPEFQKVKVVVTAATDAEALSTGQCNATQDQWQCDNGSCVWQGFRCDAHNNCGDWSDEFYCGFFSRHWPIVLGVGLGLLLLTTGCCVYCCCCRKSSATGKSVTTKEEVGTFQFVSSLGPNGQPATAADQKIYPSLDVPYQRMPQQAAGFSGQSLYPAQGTAPPPPPYTESATLHAHAPQYGTIK